MESNETSKHGLSAFEEEVENWTFVNPEDARAQELSDESSDHGSDSGSSIVVIDSQPQQQHSENLMHSQEHSDEDEDISIVALKEEELITEGAVALVFPHLKPAQPEKWNLAVDCRELQELSDVLDDPANGMESSTKQAHRFIREKSPYVVVEYSDPVDSELLHNTDMYHEDGKSNDEEGISILLADFPTTACTDLEDNSEAAGNQDCMPSVPPATLDREENVVDSVPVAASHSQAILLSPSDVESDEAVIDLVESASADNLIKSINTTEEITVCHHGLVVITDTDNREGIVDSENEAELDTTNAVSGDDEKLKKEEDWSSESSEDEQLDEEAWDLSLGALLNSGSMTSSLSSLIQEPFSPSPIIPVPSIARTVKPDLLEEANRIEEMDQLDYSAVSNPDLPPELNIANIFRDRHYVHHPNQRLNLTLTYIVAFAMAAVVGFALGHVIGLSDNFPSRCPFPSGRVFSEDAHVSDGWSKEQWRSEVQRLTALNREMNQALRSQHAEDSNSCRFDFHVNDLLTENWDLKQSIGRIRYGKPTRSLEDRDTINRLETENQDLRNTVGKLRYQCGQPSLVPSPQQDLMNGMKMKAPESVVSETLLKTLDAMNLTQFWSSLMEDDDELMDGLRTSAVDLISLIGLRREELNNLTKENTNSATEKMQVTLKKSVEKVIQLMERIHNHQGATAALADEVEIRLKELRTNLEDGWLKIFETENNAAEGRSKIPENRETSLNADWFISMGQHREELRRNEQQAHWLFERAKERERERKNSRKYQPKTKKQKVFQGNSWSHYSA